MSKKIKIAVIWLITVVLVLAISNVMYTNRETLIKVAIDKFMDIDEDYPDFAKVFVIGCERSGEFGGDGLAGERISGEDLEAHKGGVFCKQKGGTIPYQHYSNASLKGSSKDTDGTLEANSGSPASNDHFFKNLAGGVTLLREYERSF